MTIVASTMRERIAAQSVIEELVRNQSSVAPRSGIARFFGLSPLGPDSVAWYRGALGEIAVGAILAKLPPGWTVFHAVPIGTKDSDIDHLVGGPGGVFTINTKHHSGKAIWVAKRSFMVSGQKVPYIRNSEYEAARVTKMIRERMPQLLPAQPVIAVVDPKQITIREKPDQVKVIDARHLRRWLIKQPVILSNAELEQLVAFVDDPSTWRAAEPTASKDLMARFHSIDAEVRSARTCTRLWIVGLFTGLIVGAVAGLPALISWFQSIAQSLIG